MENFLKRSVLTFRKIFPAQTDLRRAGQQDKENESSYWIFFLASLFLFCPLFSCPNFCRTAHYTPHPTFLSPVPLGPSLYFSFLFRTPSFSFLLYASPLVSMGTPFGRGVVLMISPTCWNFVTFLTLLRGSYCELDYRTFGSHACFKLFVSFWSL